MPSVKRIGFELPGHPNQCDCPLCEERLLEEVDPLVEPRGRLREMMKHSGDQEVAHREISVLDAS